MTHTFYISKNLCKCYIEFIDKYVENHIESEPKVINQHKNARNFQTQLDRRRQDRLTLMKLNFKLKDLLTQWTKPNTDSSQLIIIEESMAETYSECEHILWLLTMPWI